MIEVETGVYDKNRRYGVEAGTRYVHAITRSISNISYARLIAVRQVTEEAVRQWQEKWGEIPWQNVDMTVTCTSGQVLVEFRVRP